MGKLANVLDNAPFEEARADLEKSRSSVRNILAQATSLAAGFVEVQGVAEDPVDNQRVQQRLEDAADEAKVQLDSLDTDTRQVVDDFFAGMGYTRV